MCALMFKLMIKKLKSALGNAKMEVYARMANASAEKDTLELTANTEMLTHRASSIIS
jgi:hypothetical protein